MGIEPTRPAWKAGVLPLNYTRILVPRTGLEPVREKLPTDFKSVASAYSATPAANVESGREDRIRTCDPLVPSQVLYQAELLPDDGHGCPGVDIAT